MAVTTNSAKTGLAGTVTQADLLRRPLKMSVLGNSFSTSGGAGWFYDLASASGGLLEVDTVGGVAGNTTAQMLARVGDIPATSQVCFVLEGSNDAGQSVTSTTHTANLLTICQALQSRGILPILCMSPPKDSAVATIAAYRLAEYQLARKYGYLIFDPFGGYFDATTGSWGSGYSLDGIHPTLTVYRDAGRALLDQIRGSTQRQIIQPKANAWAGMTTNNLMSSSAAGLATGWNKIGAPTASIVAAAGDGVLGNWQTFSVTAATGSQGGYQDLTLPAGSADGDEYLVRVALKTTLTSGAPGFYAFLRWVNGGGSGIRDDSFVYNTVAPAMPARIWQQTFSPPTGAVSAKLFVQMNLGTAYTAEISIGEVLVANLTRAAGF